MAQRFNPENGRGAYTTFGGFRNVARYKTGKQLSRKDLPLTCHSDTLQLSRCGSTKGLVGGLSLYGQMV